MYLRKLDPSYRYNPRGDHSLDAWSPKTIGISCHRLGLSHLSCSPHSFVTGGVSGSVKMWPEVTLRGHATEAGIHLPKSKNIVAEELGNMLNFATATGSSNTSQGPSRTGSAFLPSHHSRHNSSTLQPATKATVAGAYEAHMERAASGASSSGLGLGNGGIRGYGTPERLPASSSSVTISQQHEQQQQQAGAVKHRKSKSSGAVLPPLGPEDDQEEEEEQATARAASEGGVRLTLQQQELKGHLASNLHDQQQQQQEDRQDRTSEAGPTGRVGMNGDDALSRWQQINALRRQSSSSWPRSMQHQGWMLDYNQILIKRNIGAGSYGKVSLGTLHETDVAVKVGRIGEGAGKRVTLGHRAGIVRSCGVGSVDCALCWCCGKVE